jgi:hypothetical protein
VGGHEDGNAVPLAGERVCDSRGEGGDERRLPVPGTGDAHLGNCRTWRGPGLVDRATVAAHQQGRVLRRQNDRCDPLHASSHEGRKTGTDRRLGEAHPDLCRPSERVLERRRLATRDLDER